MLTGIWAGQTLPETTGRELENTGTTLLVFPVVLVVKNTPAHARDTCKRHGFDPWVGKISW